MDRQLDNPRRAGRWQRIGRWALAATSITAVTFLLDHLTRLQSRFNALENERLEETFQLRQNLFGLREVMGDLHVRLDESARRIESATILNARLGRTEQTLGDIGARIEAQASSLERIEEEYANFGPDILEQELSRRDEQNDTRWESLNALVSSVKEAAVVSLNEVERLEEGLHAERDLVSMWRSLVGPVVQLAGELSVGSGVLLESHPKDESDTYDTHLITAWHVVRDIQGDLDHVDMPVPVYIYSETGTVRREEAKLLAFDAEIDVALLVLTTPDELEHGARPASRERLEEVRIFDEVYAVGCPLGNDPIPTHGEVSTLDHEVDGETYWMINAPTYIGNSGGGIFDSENHELLGIFSKIYTHGTLRPTIVPHMGLVTPLNVIYDWMQGEGYAAVVPTDTVPGGHGGQLASTDGPK